MERELLSKQTTTFPFPFAFPNHLHPNKRVSCKGNESSVLHTVMWHALTGNRTNPIMLKPENIFGVHWQPEHDGYGMDEQYEEHSSRWILVKPYKSILTFYTMGEAMVAKTWLSNYRVQNKNTISWDLRIQRHSRDYARALMPTGSLIVQRRHQSTSQGI